MEAYRNCQLCPRECGVDRTAGELGACGESAACRVASASPHRGEEPCFSGRRGSGTLFFSGCSCGCFFCQNVQISHGHAGRTVDSEGLYRLGCDLAARGVHNLNFVTPDHFWPHIRRLCLRLREEGIAIPFLYNTSGYVKASLVPELAEVMDIFMPDFKFAVPALARQCIGDAEYPSIALSALREMVREVGFLRPWDETGGTTARRGVLVRHLVLPGQTGNSLAVLRLLFREFGAGLPLSVMSQYRPTALCRDRGLLTRPLRSNEYRPVLDLVEELGFEHAFIQPDFGDPDFLPDFAREEPFEGNRKRTPPAEFEG